MLAIDCNVVASDFPQGKSYRAKVLFKNPKPAVKSAPGERIGGVSFASELPCIVRAFARAIEGGVCCAAVEARLDEDLDWGERSGTGKRSCISCKTCPGKGDGDG